MSLLLVSEMFYSVQGEGPAHGVPAVFLRLGACNLQCSGFSYVHPETKEHLGCDTKAVWRVAKKLSSDEILSQWQQEKYLDKLSAGAHLVITGGEPLLQQAGIVEFLKHFDEKLFVEMETNATLAPNEFLAARITQFNVSPKLAHSGEMREKAYQSNVLAQFAAMEKAFFKFVVSKPEDIDEILRDYVQPFGLPPHRVWLMPEGGVREQLAEKALWIVEACKAHLFRYTPRLQVDIWGEVTGV